MYTDHTLPSYSIMTVDTYDRRLVTYFAREGHQPTYCIKTENKEADLEK